MSHKREKPILFNGDMVRAILEGRKTQTRRLVKGLALDWLENQKFTAEYVASPENDMCHLGKVGDQLWVRETFQGPLVDGDMNDELSRNLSQFETPEHCVYAADGGGTPEFQDADGNFCCRWKPSIHMPRWASRIQLEITDIRVERLQDITEEDAKAEGCETVRVRSGFDGSMIDVPKEQSISPTCTAGWDDCREWFADLWESINGEGAWELNPWVWVITFKRVQP